MKDFVGRCPVQDFSRSAVEQVLHALHLAMGDLREISAFREELADQVVRVLVRPSFPRTYDERSSVRVKFYL